MHVHQLKFYTVHSTYFPFACNEQRYTVKSAGSGAYYYVIVPIQSMWNDQFMAHSWSAQEDSTPITMEFGLPS
jgi:hypothetical protein